MWRHKCKYHPELKLSLMMIVNKTDPINSQKKNGKGYFNLISQTVTHLIFKAVLRLTPCMHGIST